MQVVRGAPAALATPQGTAARLAAMHKQLEGSYMAGFLPSPEALPAAGAQEQRVEAHSRALQWCIDRYAAVSSASYCRPVAAPGDARKEAVGTLLLSSEAIDSLQQGTNP